LYNYCPCNGFGATGWGFSGILGFVALPLFLFVAACFVIALLSFFVCHSRRDWFWLVMAMAFTLAADYFLILHDRHRIGVAVFCFAHVAYILRAKTAQYECNRLGVLACSTSQKRGNRFINTHFMYVDYALRPYLVMTAILILVATLWFGGVYTATVLYALLFVSNIYLSARHIQHNRVLVMAGLLLFAACDICVMLFNLPVYLGAPLWLRQINPLIWMFYLPSQVLLAVSAIDSGRLRRSRRC